MSTTRQLGLAGSLVLSAILGGTLMSAVMAAPANAPVVAPVADPPASAPAGAAGATAKDAGKYCETYRAAFAANLGTTEDAVRAAAKAAAADTLDAAVSAGNLTKVAADRLKTRIAASDADLCKLMAGWRGRLVKAAVNVTRDALDAASDALKMTPADLRTALRAADLKAIAADHGVDYATLTGAITSAVKADLDAAVKAGTITQAREDRILGRLADRLAVGRLRPAK